MLMTRKFGIISRRNLENKSQNQICLWF